MTMAKTETTRTAMSTEQLQEIALSIESEVSRVIVGQKEIVRGVLICLLAGGHALLEGVPGLGKTMLVRTLSEVLDLRYSRIQFTPDLMPADITGTNVIAQDAEGLKHFRFEPGPVFANLVLADEINRATPKTQSALLEAMQEKTVTTANHMHTLPKPFFVLATQNPLEMEGTYPLPEAQLDRFFLKLNVAYPSADELVEVLRRTTAQASVQLSKVADGQTLLAMGELVREVPMASHVLDYVARLVLATHPENPEAPEITRKYVRYGASPRGAQALVLAGKIRALLEGRFNVSYEDIDALACPALRHRIILNFEGDIEGMTTDHMIAQLVAELPKD